MKIILDNGHGINTPGKRSPDGSLREFEFNRTIVNGICAQLDGAFDVHILVPEIEDIGLKERCERVNQIDRRENCILISVHANAGGGTGWEVFTYIGQNESDIIANVFARKAESLFPEFKMRFDRSDGDLDKESHFYILKHTTCPAILTENFFMDTEKDLKFISSTKGRARIIDHHVVSIKNYFANKLLI